PRLAGGQVALCGESGPVPALFVYPCGGALVEQHVRRPTTASGAERLALGCLVSGEGCAGVSSGRRFAAHVCGGPEFVDGGESIEQERSPGPGCGLPEQVLA